MSASETQAQHIHLLMF